MPNTLVLIPARMASTRLPGKPLAMIGDKPMIIHVADRSREAGYGEPVVATDSQEIMDVCAAHRTKSVMTRDDHPSGSDRIFEALETLDPAGKVDLVVNVQGDLPTLDPEIIRTAVALMDEPSVDIGTLATVITDVDEMTNPDTPRAVSTPITPDHHRALYFTRGIAPYGDGPVYHHIGLYVYRRDVLARFVSMPPSTLEKREKLEQLRALEAGMRIDVGIVGGVPLGVDTPADLDRARQMLSG